jgi:short-subunit dehydrogenase
MLNDLLVRAGAPLAMAILLLYKGFRGGGAVHVDGQLVLISGASSGIGRELALLLTARGAEVIIVARREAALKEVEREVEARGWGGRIYALPCDCSDGSAVEELVEKVRAIWGDAGPDVVVNCAGAGRWLMLDESTVEEVAACFHAPLLAAANMCRAFIQDMKSKGAGTFVQVQSPGAVTSWGGCTAYLASRWALRGLSLALQADLRGSGVLVQEVILPEVDSEYWRNNPGSRQRVPWLGRFLGVPNISSRKAAVYVARAIESRAGFTCFGGTLPLLIQLNLVLPR